MSKDKPGIDSNTFSIQFNKDWLCNSDILKPITLYTGRGGYRLIRNTIKKQDIKYHIRKLRYKVRHGKNN